MSIFRVEKNTNYTVISNYHLRDKNLSLKTIGLLSLILSLPDNWDYSQSGLAAICKDGEDSIRSGLKELEKYGYLDRERERDENGRMKGIIYKVYEVPKHQRDIVKSTCVGPADANKRSSTNINTPIKAKPISDLPKRENPILVSPVVDLPTQEFPTQVGEAQIIKDKQNKDLINIDLQTNQSINYHELINVDRGEIDGKRDIAKYDNLKQYIRENINYDFFKFKSAQIEEKFETGQITIDEYDSQTSTYDIKKLDQVICYMLDILSSINNDPIKIGDEIIGREVVKSKLMKTKMLDIQKVVLELNTNPSIKNPKKYAISMLYNA